MSGFQSNRSIVNRVATVTGGGSGIGSATALAFARAGAQVAVVARTLGKVEAVADRIAGEGGAAFALQADVSQSADVQRMVATVAERYGGVDILYNNAGVSPSGRITEISEGEDDHRAGVCDRRRPTGGDERVGFTT